MVQSLVLVMSIRVQWLREKTRTYYLVLVSYSTVALPLWPGTKLHVFTVCPCPYLKGENNNTYSIIVCGTVNMSTHSVFRNGAWGIIGTLQILYLFLKLLHWCLQMVCPERGKLGRKLFLLFYLKIKEKRDNLSYPQTV